MAEIDTALSYEFNHSQEWKLENQSGAVFSSACIVSVCLYYCFFFFQPLALLCYCICNNDNK